MDYALHYERLIERAKGRSLSVPTESHHIVPRCMGGSDRKSNRVDLTPEEHYVAHQLLTKLFPDHPGLALAAVQMATDNRNGKRAGNKLYGWLRRRAAKASGEARRGAVVTPATRAKISAAIKNSGRHREYVRGLVGVPRTDDVKRKLSVSAKSEAATAARAAMHARKVGVPRSPETIAKVAAARVGQKMSEEQKAKISAALKGRQKSPEHLAKIAAALTGKPSAIKGRPKSAETRAKMSAAAVGRQHTAETRRKMATIRTSEQRRTSAQKAWVTRRS